MNVKKLIAVPLFSLLLLTGVACSGAGPTPTRTPRAVAELEATQTPWIIYIPVTTTPEPATATPLPTVTPDRPEPTATRTRAPAPVATQPPPTPAQPTEPPSPEPPPATPTPSCGDTYQVKKLTFPENGVQRRARASGAGGGAAIIFKWEPIADYEMDPKLGYRVLISTGRNSAALYISHNEYLNMNQAVLSQQATYGLTQGDDSTARWSVEVVRVTGDFQDAGDDLTTPLGTVITCGPSSETWTIELHVEE